MAHQEKVNEEVQELKKYIRRLGNKNDKGQYEVTFGVLFDDDEGQQYFEAIVGTLKSAKKRKIITFKGQMLLKGAHDDVVITLLVDNDVDDANDNAQQDDQKDANDDANGDA